MVRYTEVSAPLRSARDLGWRWKRFGAGDGESRLFDFHDCFSGLGAPLFLSLPGAGRGRVVVGKDYVIFILFFGLQNAQHRIQHSGETQQGFMG